MPLYLQPNLYWKLKQRAGVWALTKWQIFKNGVFNENPTFRLVLGMCPTLAVTTAVVNGLGMGIATTLVLAGSNVIIALLRNVIPKEIRIPGVYRGDCHLYHDY